MTVSIKLFKKFTSRLGLYNGLLFQMKTHLKHIAGDIQSQNLNIDSANQDRFLLGSHLSYKNLLTGKQEFPYTHEVTTKNLSKTLEDLNIEFSNFCISQCYEAFETFLKDIITIKLLDNPTFALKIDKVIDTTNFEICRKSIDSIRTKNDHHNAKLFKILRRLNKEISENIDLHLKGFDDWYIVFSEIRHSIVHSNSMIKKSLTENWSTYQKELLNDFFLKEIQDETIKINTFKYYGTVIQAIAQQGQLIFDSLEDASK